MGQRLLQELRLQLRKRAKSLFSSTGEISVEHLSDPMEEAQARTHVDVAITGLNAEWATARAIEEAIDRVKSGEYGLCLACGHPIHPKRLEAIPWARFCVDCQRESEAIEAQPEAYANAA
jgi:DnaK suppressor protein